MANIRRCASICGAALALGACASFLNRPEPPRVSLAGIDIIELGLIEQRLDLQLRLQNPNDFALPMEGMDFVLQLNYRDFAHGVSNEPVTIPAFGEVLVSVDVVSNVVRIYEQLRELSTDHHALRYELSGGVGLSEFGGKIPFETEGEIMLAPQSRRD